MTEIEKEIKRNKISLWVESIVMLIGLIILTYIALVIYETIEGMNKSYMQIFKMDVKYQIFPLLIVVILTIPCFIIINTKYKKIELDVLLDKKAKANKEKRKLSYTKKEVKKTVYKMRAVMVVLTSFLWIPFIYGLYIYGANITSQKNITNEELYLYPLILIGALSILVYTFYIAYKEEESLISNYDK